MGSDMPGDWIPKPGSNSRETQDPRSREVTDMTKGIGGPDTRRRLDKNISLLKSHLQKTSAQEAYKKALFKLHRSIAILTMVEQAPLFQQASSCLNNTMELDGVQHNTFQ